MTRTARLRLFGPPVAERDGQTVNLDRKPVALLAYLAVTGQRVGRATLTALLWPDTPAKRAGGNLRKAIWQINNRLGPEVLAIDTASATLIPGSGLWVDVVAFERLVGPCLAHDSDSGERCSRCPESLQAAVGLYRDDFMAGFTLRGCVEFDDWRVLHTEHLRQKAIATLDRHVRMSCADGNLDLALAHARQRLDLDPLHEAAHRQLMGLLVWTGRRSDALKQFELCAALLGREFGVAPEEQTIELNKAIQDHRLLPPVGSWGSVPASDGIAASIAPSEAVPVSGSIARSAGWPGVGPAVRRHTLDRVVISPDDVVARELRPPLYRLLAAVLGDDETVRLSESELLQVANHSPLDLVGYRLGRVAEWSLPRYRLDKRFVKMSLLVDLGEESLAGRWQVQEERFTDLRDVLNATSEPAVAVLGPPGSGKSTLLRRLEFDLAVNALRPRDADVPSPLTFLISLTQFKPATPGDPLPAPREWLNERWAARFPKLPPLELAMAGRPIIFLLDGLNEMPHQSPDGYRLRIALWKQFLQETLTCGNGHRAAITCRSLDYAAPLSTPDMRVPQVQLEPLTDAMVKEFLQRYSPENATALWDQLRGTDLLSAVNWPLFLRLLLEAAAESGAIQGGRAALFTSYVRRALVREMQRDNPNFVLGGLIDPHDYRRAASGHRWRTPHELPMRGELFPRLADLAYGMQAATIEGESSQVRISHADALALLDCTAAEAIVRAGSDLGVLDADWAVDDVMFQHQLLQEYFAGRKMAAESTVELLRQPWRAAQIRPSVDEVIDGLAPADPLPGLRPTGWEETALLAAGLSADVDRFVRDVAAVNLALAGRCAAQSDVRERLAADVLDELRWALVERSRNPEADLRDRVACGHVVGDLGDPRFERRQGPHGAYLMPPLIEIPAGVYPIGDDVRLDFVGRTSTAHIPRHEVEVAAIQIGQLPVTNAEWLHFLAAGGYEDERWWDTEAGRAWRRGENTAAGQYAGVRHFLAECRARPEIMDEALAAGSWDQASYARAQRRLLMSESELEAHLRELYPGGRLTEPRHWRDARFNRPTQPVVGICWFEARAYCSWLAAQTGLPIRLPSEVEWEAAARGKSGRRYAYGDDFDRLKGNTAETHIRQPAPVGVFPEGDTPEGVCDLTGNVLEWTSSAFGEDIVRPRFGYPYDRADGREEADQQADVRRVIRGGGWDDATSNTRAAFRDNSPPDTGHFSYGFRVVV